MEFLQSSFWPHHVNYAPKLLPLQPTLCPIKVGSVGFERGSKKVWKVAAVMQIGEPRRREGLLVQGYYHLILTHPPSDPLQITYASCNMRKPKVFHEYVTLMATEL